MKVNKSISIIKKLRYILPRKSLVAIYKAFFAGPYWLWWYHSWPTSKLIFLWKIRICKVQSYISNKRVHSRYILWKNYQELGLESPKLKRWYRCLSCMFEILKEEASNYLIKLFPKNKQTIRPTNNHIQSYSCRTDHFKYYFFLSTLND